MSEELMNVADVESVFSDISTMIYTAKNEVMMRVNTSVISLYWNIGKKLSDEVLQGKKAEYGKNIIGDLSERLTAEYGKGFEKSSVFKMVKFYQEFPEYEKVATLSQQLTWSHFVELLPIEDALWCCAAPNKDVRCLAMKLLYEVVRQNTEYKRVLIDMYESIVDPYIK